MPKTDSDWKTLIHATRHTYYPVCGKDIDDVQGVLCTKDYFRLEDKSRENVMKKAVTPAVFVAENTPANTLFYKMKMTREYFAVVVDEYGGMSGIVTLHDLLEQLVGELTTKPNTKSSGSATGNGKSRDLRQSIKWKKCSASSSRKKKAGNLNRSADTYGA